MNYLDQPGFQEDEGVLEGLVKAPIRGVAGAAAGVANLFGADIQDNFGLGRSQGVASGFLEGLSQFLVGFIPVAGWIGRGGSILSKGAQAAAKTKAGAAAISAGRSAAAGAVADFAVFDGNDPRLSNLIQDIPALQNPLTEFLAADEEDGEVVGRLKNVVEGAGLGLLADGLVAMFKKMRTRNKAVRDGDSDAVARLDQEIGETAEELNAIPNDSAEAELDGLLEPGEKRRKWEEEGLAAEPEVPQDPKPETITKQDAEKRLMADPDQGDVLIVRAGDTSEFMRGMSRFESWTREPGSRVSLVQLKGDARVATPSAMKRLVKRPAGMPKDQYEDLLIQTAKDQGYDVFQKPLKGRGDTESIVLNQDAIHKQVNVQSREPFFDTKAQARQVQDPSIVAKSPIEQAAYNLNLTKDRAKSLQDSVAKIREGAEPLKEYKKIRGQLDITKHSEAGQVAFHQLMADEIGKVIDDPMTVEEFTREGARELAKFVGMDPHHVAKSLVASSENVDLARSRAIGAKVVIRDLAADIKAVADRVANFDAARAVEGTPEALELDKLMEEFARSAENYTTVATGFTKLKRSGGRFLRSLGISIDDLTSNEIIEAVRSRGGRKRLLNVAKRIAQDGEFGLEMIGQQLIKRTRKSAFYNAFTDWWMFSLLSAPKTLTTNIVGSGLAAIFKPLETTVGAWLQKKLVSPEAAQQMNRMMRTETRQARFTASMFKELATFQKAMARSPEANFALSQGVRAAKEGSPILTGRGAFDDAVGKPGEGFSKENLEVLTNRKIDENSPTFQAMQYIASVIKVPGRFLAGSDEVIKQVYYQALVKSELVEQAAELGLRDLDAENWVNSEMRRMTIRGEALTEQALRRQGEQRFKAEYFVDEANRQQHIDAWIEKKRYRIDEGVEAPFDRTYLAERAAKAADEITFTTPLDPKRGFLSRLGHGIQDLAAAHPWVRMFAPFVRTPMNILMFTGSRLPIPGVNKDFVSMLTGVAAHVETINHLLPEGLKRHNNEWIKQIKSSDPRVASEAAGRAATTMALGTVLGGAAAAGVITGGGPPDHEQMKVLRASGWQPYSIKVGDTYVSYQRLDPLAGLLAFYGDYAETARWAGVGDDNVMAKAGHAAFAATLENLKSKSYLQGVIDLVNLISDPENQASRTAGRLAGSLMVPNAIAALRGFTDDNMAEARGVMDSIRRRIPFLNDNAMEPQRNVLGEPLNKKQLADGLRAADGFVGYFLPLSFNRTTSDRITQELADLAYPFTAPEPKRLGVDLRDFTNSKGQTAYDRWQELTGEIKVKGRKLRPALERLFNSKDYKALPKESLDKMDITSPRVVMVQRLVRSYRRAAQEQVMEEFDDLRKQTLLRADIQQRMSQGQQPSDLQALLGF